MSEILKSKWLRITGLILGTILVYILFILSLLPLVQWWAGLIALIPFGYFIFLKFVKKDETLFEKKYIAKWYRLLLYTIFFGIFAHLSCGVYTCYRMHEFKTDAYDERTKVFEMLKTDSKEAQNPETTAETPSK